MKCRSPGRQPLNTPPLSGSSPGRRGNVTSGNGLSPGSQLLGASQERSDPERKQSAATATGQEPLGVQTDPRPSPDPSHTLTFDHSHGLIPDPSYNSTHHPSQTEPHPRPKLSPDPSHRLICNPSCRLSPDSQQTGSCSQVQTDSGSKQSPSPVSADLKLLLCPPSPALCVLTPRLRPPWAALAEAKPQLLEGDSLVC